MGVRGKDDAGGRRVEAKLTLCYSLKTKTGSIN